MMVVLARVLVFIIAYASSEKSDVIFGIFDPPRLCIDVVEPCSLSSSSSSSSSKDETDELSSVPIPDTIDDEANVLVVSAFANSRSSRSTSLISQLANCNSAFRATAKRYSESERARPMLPL